MRARFFQEQLHQLAMRIGAESHALFRRNFEGHWPNEESTTDRLFGAVEVIAQRLALQEGPVVVLEATSTTKRAEAGNGVDVLIRMRCDEEDWKISTSTLVQAKRHEPRTRMDAADHQRLQAQLAKMLSFTTEAFVMIYSRELGIQLIPAVAALSLPDRDLFALTPTAWPDFLSALLRGQIGEIAQRRVPQDGIDWQPMFELDIQVSFNAAKETGTLQARS